MSPEDSGTTAEPAQIHLEGSEIHMEGSEVHDQRHNDLSELVEAVRQLSTSLIDINEKAELAHERAILADAKISSNRLRINWLTILLVLSLIIATLTGYGAMKANETLDAIHSCTQPGGQCFEDSNARSTAVVKSIIDQIHDDHSQIDQSNDSQSEETQRILCEILRSTGRDPNEVHDCAKLPVPK